MEGKGAIKCLKTNIKDARLELRYLEGYNNTHHYVWFWLENRFNCLPEHSLPKVPCNQYTIDFQYEFMWDSLFSNELAQFIKG